MKTNKELGALVKACREVLEVAKKHPYLWDNQESEEIWGKNREKAIHLAGGFIAQDEYYSIRLVKHGKRLEFRGSNMSDNGKGITNYKTAAEWMLDYNISAEILKHNFYDSLRNPLGRYLASEYLKSAEKGCKEVER
jgi:hypothetical protein